MYYKTRSQFTQTDYRFIAETLSGNASVQQAILKLTEDPYTVTEFLHKKELFERSMTTPPLFLSISPQLFFYIFVYHALERKQLAEDDVVDYVAGVCVEFRSSESFWQLATTEGGKTFYMVDLLNFLPDLDRTHQYFLRRYIGNVTLFLTGFFPDFIFKRSIERSAPPLAYYEHVGRSQYETAADESSAFDENAGPVLNTLAERFVDIRSAINLHNDAHFHLNRKHSLDIIQRQAATLDEESFRQSLQG